MKKFGREYWISSFNFCFLSFPELLAQYEKREKLIADKAHEYDLQLKLYEAQLAKSKIERAEINTDFTKERLEVRTYTQSMPD